MFSFQPCGKIKLREKNMYMATESYENGTNCVIVCKDLCLQNKSMSLIDSDPLSIVCLACYVEGVVDLKELMQ